MTSEATPNLIFFIGAVVIAMGVIGAAITNVQSIAASYGMKSKTLADQLKTEITIINDPQIIPYLNNNYTFYVKNTGKTTLGITNVNLLVDGKYIPDLNKTIIGGNIWYPSYVLTINYTTSRFTRWTDHNVTVVAENGVFDSLPFKCIDSNYCQ